MITRALKQRNFLKVGDILPRTFEKVEVSKKFDLRPFGQKVIRVKGIKKTTFGKRFLRLKRSLRTGRTESNKDIIRNIRDISQLFQPENIRRIGDMPDNELRVLIRGLRDTGFDTNYKLHIELTGLATTVDNIDGEGWLTGNQVKTVIPFVSAHAMLNWQKRTNLNVLGLRGNLSPRNPIWLWIREKRGKFDIITRPRVSIPVPLSNILNIKADQKYSLVDRIILPLNMIVTQQGDIITRDPRTRAEIEEEIEEEEEEILGPIFAPILGRRIRPLRAEEIGEEMAEQVGEVQEQMVQQRQIRQRTQAEFRRLLAEQEEFERPVAPPRRRPTEEEIRQRLGLEQQQMMPIISPARRELERQMAEEL